MDYIDQYERTNSIIASYPIIVFILIFIFFVIILVIIFGRSITRSGTKYGTWEEPEPGPCKGPGGCGTVGTRKIKSVCIPHPITNLGCIDDFGIPSYAYRIREESCNMECILSEFEVEDTACIENVVTRTFTCVSKDSTGNNNCSRIREFSTIQGIVHNVEYFLPGEGYSIEIPCKPNQSPGVWVATNDNNTNITLTPFLAGTYDPNETCSSISDYGVMNEGMIYLPMECMIIDDNGRHYITDKSNCPVIPNSKCFNRLPTLDDSPLDSAIICADVVLPDETPYYGKPCRYRPLKSIDYGYTDINVLSNHFLLVSMDENILATVQVPTIQSTIIELRDSGDGPDENLRVCPITTFDTSMFNKSNCTIEAMNFNTGTYFQLGLRDLVSPTSFIAIIGLLSSGRFKGWMRSIDNVIYWNQANISFDIPSYGTHAINVERFLIEIVSPHYNIPVSGYPYNRGTIGIRIRKENGDNLYIWNGDLLINLTCILFPYTTEVCSAAIRGESSCSLYTSLQENKYGPSVCTPDNVI